jgi:hypothetical protein
MQKLLHFGIDENKRRKFDTILVYSGVDVIGGVFSEELVEQIAAWALRIGQFHRHYHILAAVGRAGDANSDAHFVIVSI